MQVLLKNLRDFAEETIADNTDVSLIIEALEVLELVFGNTRDTGRAVVQDFQTDCSKPDDWNKEASVERHKLIFKVLEF